MCTTMYTVYTRPSQICACRFGVYRCIRQLNNSVTEVYTCVYLQTSRSRVWRRTMYPLVLFYALCFAIYIYIQVNKKFRKFERKYRACIKRNRDKIGTQTCLCYINVTLWVRRYIITCLCPNLVSIPFYASPIFPFKFPKFFIYLSPVFFSGTRYMHFCYFAVYLVANILANRACSTFSTTFVSEI